MEKPDFYLVVAKMMIESHLIKEEPIKTQTICTNLCVDIITDLARSRQDATDMFKVLDHITYDLCHEMCFEEQWNRNKNGSN